MTQKVKTAQKHERAPLARVVAAQRVLREHAPRLTVVGVELLMFVAERTARKAEVELPPTTKEIREALGLKMTGASRLLEALSSGRKDRGVEGYGLVESDDFLGPSRTGVWVLTEKGIQCVREYLAALAGGTKVDFEPQDSGSFLKVMVSRYERRRSRSK